MMDFFKRSFTLATALAALIVLVQIGLVAFLCWVVVMVLKWQKVIH